MKKNSDFDSIIHSDGNGKLYIKSPDFFNQKKVQGMVMSLMNSSVFKKIEMEKKKK